MKILLTSLFVLVTLFVSHPAFAMGYDTRADACHTFHLFAHEKQQEKQAETDGIFCGSIATTPKQTTHNVTTTVKSPAIPSTSTNVVNPPTSNPAPVVNPPANNPPVDNPPAVSHDDKPKCNNGNGNGAESCNASDKGNQDETPQKGDKDVNHPTH